MRFVLMSQICNQAVKRRKGLWAYPDLTVLCSCCEALSVRAETDTSDVEVACAICRLVKQHTAR